MVDLTKIEKPLGLLDAETQAALKAHGGPYQRFLYDWREDIPAWLDWGVYRVKPFEYKPGKLYDWTGGECPVDGNTVVNAVLRYGVVTGARAASYFEWDHDGGHDDVIAFVIEEPES